MQYLVQVSGDITNKLNKTYVVNSNSLEKAQVMATQNFCEEFEITSADVYVKSHRRTVKAIFAFIFMLVPILLSLISWKNGHDTISISPDYISCLYGTLIYAAFIVRFKGVQRMVSSWIDILFCVFSILLLSSFVKTILATETISILGLTKFTIDSKVLLPIAIVLSWLGLKFVSLVCMAIIAIIALFNITALNAAMGMICGPLYVICSFVGIVMYLAVEPAYLETLSHFKSVAAKGLSRLNNEITQTKSKAISIKSSITSKTNSENEGLRGEGNEKQV